MISVAKFIQDDLGAALGAATSKDPAKGALSGAFAAVMAETIAEMMVDKPAEAMQKSMEKGEAVTMESFLQSYDVSAKKAAEIAKVITAATALALNLDVEVAGYVANNALKNNFAQFALLAAVSAFDAYEQDLVANRDAIIDLMVEKTGMSRETAATTFDTMMQTGRLASMVANLIPGRKKAVDGIAKAGRALMKKGEEKLAAQNAPQAKGQPQPNGQPARAEAEAQPAPSHLQQADQPSESFFQGTKYSPKVAEQMRNRDMHGFPEGVKMFEKDGTVTKITGGDGITRDMLKIPGEYKGKQGNFEFIKEPDGTINHRFFRPTTD